MTPTIDVVSLPPEEFVPAKRKDMMTIISDAVSLGFSAEQLRELVELRDHCKREDAKDAFCKAMSACQAFGEADCPLPNHYRIIATVRHRDGHSEEYHGDYPLDGQGSAGGKSGMNAIQAKGSSNSYGRKYMHFMIFNLALANEDNDGAGALDTLTGDEMVQVRDLIDAKGVDVDKFLAWAKVKTVGEILRRDLPKVLDVLKRKTGGAK